MTCNCKPYSIQPQTDSRLSLSYCHVITQDLAPVFQATTSTKSIEHISIISGYATVSNHCFLY